MKRAFFVLHLTSSTTDSQFATLSSIAQMLAKHGIESTLLIASSSWERPVPHLQSFGKVIAVNVPEDIGDGAHYLGMLVAHFQNDLGAEYVIGFSNLANKNWAPQIAAPLAGEYLNSCEDLWFDGEHLLAAGAVMGGLVRKMIDLSDRPAVVLYAGEERTPADAGAEQHLTGIDLPLSSDRIRLVASAVPPGSGGIPLNGASVIVSGGLGVGSLENWKLIEEFAGKIGAAVGASRAAVEMGWAPSSRQVGFSGQKVRPDVYIAVGISGALHHLAGIGGAKKIVAINKDPEASIFKVADIAIVGDFKEVLTAAIGKLG
jgi:electron transfer flavoprotein alpha subunit